MAAQQKAVKPTIHKYSIVNRLTGQRENVKDIVCTFYHNGIVELETIGRDFLTYETDLIILEKY